MEKWVGLSRHEVAPDCSGGTLPSGLARALWGSTAWTRRQTGSQQHTWPWSGRSDMTATGWGQLWPEPMWWFLFLKLVISIAWREVKDGVNMDRNQQWHLSNLRTHWTLSVLELPALQPLRTFQQHVSPHQNVMELWFLSPGETELLKKLLSPFHRPCWPKDPGCGSNQNRI